MRRAAETPDAERPPGGPPLCRPPRIGVGALLCLALPSAAFTLLTNGYRIVDQYLVQGVSVAAQAAVSASVFVLILFYAAFELVATGAGDLELRRRLLGQSLSAVLVQSAFLMAIGVAAAPAIAVALGLSRAPAAECSRYLTALFAIILPLAVTPLIDQTFLAMGNAAARPARPVAGLERGFDPAPGLRGRARGGGCRPGLERRARRRQRPRDLAAQARPGAPFGPSLRPRRAPPHPSHRCAHGARHCALRSPLPRWSAVRWAPNGPISHSAHYAPPCPSRPCSVSPPRPRSTSARCP